MMQTAAAFPSSAYPNASSSREAKTVLLVEDDQDIREALSELLTLEGYQVVCAANGLEALELLRLAEKLPSLILLDLMMPVMDGPQFRNEQLSVERIAGIPLILMSADNRLASYARSLKANAHLRKPIQVNHLLDTLADHCS